MWFVKVDNVTGCYSVAVSRSIDPWNESLLVSDSQRHERYVNIFSDCLISRTNLIHFTITFTLLKLKATTCCGHHLPILRRHYTKCYRCRLLTVYGSNHSPWAVYIYNSTLHPPKLRSCSACRGWASDGRYMSRLWVLMKWIWSWSVSIWCVL
jgi:hypothetical protein